MRRLSLASIALLSLLGIAGCGDEEPIEPLADFRYTLGCGSRTGCFSKSRDINGFNNEEGVIVSCTAGSGSAGSTLSFRLSALDPIDMRTRFSFSVANVIYDAAGSPVGTSGLVTVAEGANSYTGTISAAPPSATAPCQLRNIAKTMDDVGNPQIEGDILCGTVAGNNAIGLTQSGVPTEKRDIHDPLSASTAAHFRIVLCGGLPIPD